MINERLEQRDLLIGIAGLFLGAPAAGILLRGSSALLPLLSPARPEILLSIGIAGTVALLLIWNALACTLALASLASALPRRLRLLLARTALRCGPLPARRIARRALASTSLSLAALGLGLSGAIAAPTEPPASAQGGAISWLWEPTGSPASEESADSSAQSALGARTDESPQSPERSPSAPTSARGPAVSTPSTTATPSLTPPPPPEASEGGEAPAADSPSLPPQPALAPDARHLVRPGESLWTIAASLLPAGTPPARIDATWRAIYALNSTTLGPDPSLIHPGDVLVLPQEQS